MKGGAEGGTEGGTEVDARSTAQGRRSKPGGATPQKFSGRTTRSAPRSRASAVSSAARARLARIRERLAAVLTDRGEFAGDDVVLALGSWSPLLARHGFEIVDKRSGNDQHGDEGECM